MVVGEAVTVAGLGSRRGVSAAEVLAAVAAARAAVAAPPRLDALATVPAKAAEPGFADAARSLGVPLMIAGPEGEARLATGAASASETAALAAVGPGGRLLGARIVAGRVTCAIAVSEEAQ